MMCVMGAPHSPSMDARGGPRNSGGKRDRRDDPAMRHDRGVQFRQVGEPGDAAETTRDVTRADS
jgi:hypothetical protein